MTTTTKKIQSSSVELEKNWEYRDRTYLLKSNLSPVSYTIQTRHTPRKPLMWFDENLKINREIRLSTNQKSLFVDEQSFYHFIILKKIKFGKKLIMLKKRKMK